MPGTDWVMVAIAIVGVIVTFRQAWKLYMWFTRDSPSAREKLRDEHSGNPGLHLARQNTHAIARSLLIRLINERFHL